MQLHDVLSELRREMAIREHVYPAWAESGRISLNTARNRIKLLAEAIAIMEALSAAEPHVVADLLGSELRRGD